MPAKRDTATAPSLPTTTATTTPVSEVEVEKKEEIDEPAAAVVDEEAIVTEPIIELAGEGLEDNGGD